MKYSQVVMNIILVTLTDGLYDHGVHLVGAKLELVARQAVSETEGHGRELLLRETGDERLHLTTQTAHQLLHRTVVHAGQVQLVLWARGNNIFNTQTK